MSSTLRPSSDSTIIRDFRPEEIPRMHEIDRLCFPDYMAYSRAELIYFVKHAASITRIAECAGEIIGFAVGCCAPGSQAHIITLDVAPEARRRRVGTALMEALHEEFRKRGVVQVALEVATGNESAQRFYEKLGYELKKLLRGYYKNRSDAYQMVRQLSPRSSAADA
jgi:[ribosomal protein S18]-alanine N-acetyltransferase